MDLNDQQVTEAVRDQQEGPVLQPLLDQIVNAMGMSADTDETEAAKTEKRNQIEAVRKASCRLLERVLTAEPLDVPISDVLVNSLIEEIDRRIGLQVDDILHAKEFQQLEAAWRALKLLVDHTDFRESIELNLLNVTEGELRRDFREMPARASFLYKVAYRSAYGTFGGKPYGAIIANFELGPSNADMGLLADVATVSSLAHAPFIAAASPKFFGIEKFTGLPGLRDVDKKVEEGVLNNVWKSFRKNNADARSVGLTLPRFLLRLPYDPIDNPIESFKYQENVAGGHEDYLWGNTAFAFATRLTESFAKYRWCANIIGPMGGGTVERLPLHTFDSLGNIDQKIPTEVLISHDQELELANAGFIPLVIRKGEDNACFFSANSCQLPKTFPLSEDETRNFRLGTMLPYTFMISRLAHYIKVMQVERLGLNLGRTQLQKELDDWLKLYVANYDALPDVRARRPFRVAAVEVGNAPEPGWYEVKITIQPDFKYQGARFTLSLVGRHEKSLAKQSGSQT